MVKEKRAVLLISSFGEVDRRPLELLEKAGIEYSHYSPLGHLTGNDMHHVLEEADALIVGTSSVTAEVMEYAPRLKIISRVGIGLDNVDLNTARQRGIQVAYTPDAPSSAVAELTLGLMVSLLRGVTQANDSLREGKWERVLGRSLSELTVGLIGVNRIGKLVARHLTNFGSRLIANDIAPDEKFGSAVGLRWVEKDELFREADVISLHVPLTAKTKNLIGNRELMTMKKSAILINTARGGLIDETSLVDALRDGTIAGAALDVFSEEPYSGELTRLSNCLLTSHIGSMTREARLRMEVEAVKNVLCCLNGEPIPYSVPESEYCNQIDAEKII